MIDRLTDSYKNVLRLKYTKTNNKAQLNNIHEAVKLLILGDNKKCLIESFWGRFGTFTKNLKKSGLIRNLQNSIDFCRFQILELWLRILSSNLKGIL